MAEPVSLINVLSEHLVDILTTYLIYDVDEADIDPEWKNVAGLVRAGKLQANPLIGKINILVREGGQDWPDVLATKNNQDSISAPTYEFGDGGLTTWFLRRFIVEFRIYLKTSDRLYAQKSKNIVVSKAYQAILSRDSQSKLGANGTDDFGESAHLSNIRTSYLREGGGPGTFIWKGKIEVEFLTSFDA